jgi:hypothetical protein
VLTSKIARNCHLLAKNGKLTFMESPMIKMVLLNTVLLNMEIQP